MSFNNLVGQPELRRLLTRAFTDDRLSHALLLTGPAGSGKKSWGRAIARAILCTDRCEAEPCTKCGSCRRFDSGNHPHFFHISPEGRKIKIEQVRSLRERFYLSGGSKVCLIEQVEAMTAEACSSLLKILEEPPSGLYFILLAEQCRFLFDTIVSRCQLMALQPLSKAELTGLLIENKNIPAEKAGFLARLSGGLPGYAYELAESEQFAVCFEEAKTLAMNLVSGRDSVRQLLTWAASLAERDDLLSFLELLCLFYRDGLIRNLFGSDEFLADQEQQYTWLEAVSFHVLEEVILLINEAVYQINATNANRRLLMEKMLITIQRRLIQCQR